MIQLTIDERARALQRFREAVDGAGPALDAVSRKRLARSLAMQASDAEASLRSLMENTQRELGVLSGAARVFRGYAPHSRKSFALDHSG